MSDATTPVILSACRTPIGKYLGGLSPLPGPRLGALVIREAMVRAGIPDTVVDEVIMGNVLQGGEGQAPARQAAIHAGLPGTIPAMTINKVCGSGLKAVMLAAQVIKAGDEQCVVAGGFESMSNAPHYVYGMRGGIKAGNSQLVDGMIHDGLWDSFSNTHKPSFEKGGTVTPGNAPGLNDGASALVVSSLAFAKAHGVKPIAKITGYATGGGEPKDLFFAPIVAVQNLMKKVGTKVSDYDLIEANEAFAVQALADGKALAWDWSRVNVHGGAIALGHPIGASGARVLTTLLYALKQYGKRTGLATLCLGGGNAVALSVEMI